MASRGKQTAPEGKPRAAFFMAIRWQHFNALLAALVWMTVLGSLYFGYYLVGIHADSVKRHQMDATLFEQINQLSDAIVAVNGAANDVFESQNLAEGKADLAAGLRNCNEHHANIQQQLQLDSNAELRQLLQADTRDLLHYSTEMAADAQQIFFALRARDLEAADQQRTILNRRFALAVRHSSDLRRRIRTKRLDSLAAEANLVRELKQYETLIAIGTLILVLVGTSLACLLSRKMLHDERAMIQQNQALQHYTTELEAAQTSLRTQATEMAEQTALLKTANSEAAEADRAKSEFLANMSHEMRTPMTAILGFAELLLSRMQNGDNLDAVRTIHRNGNHLLRLINDVLDLSRLESGSLSVEHAKCAPRRLVAEAVEAMRSQAEAKGLKLEVEYAADLPPVIVTDELRLRQILTNLISNAIKFTRSGQLIVSVRGDCNAGPAVLRLAVMDTGIGISEAQLQKLFQPFTQADGSSSRRYGGTGLGLAISQRLIELLEGQLSVESRLGFGSTFEIIIPMRVAESIIPRREHRGARLLGTQDLSRGTAEPADTNGVESTLSTAPPLVGARILLVEDGPDNQRLISHVLRKAGAEVELADNGAVAVARVAAAQEQGAPFDLIVMDMQMPVMDGYEATRQLKTSGYARPIIALTAHAMVGDREKCLAAGCDGYTTKPIDRQQMISIIAGFLQQPVTAV